MIIISQIYSSQLLSHCGSEFLQKSSLQSCLLFLHFHIDLNKSPTKMGKCGLMIVNPPRPNLSMRHFELLCRKKFISSLAERIKVIHLNDLLSNSRIIVLSVSLSARHDQSFSRRAMMHLFQQYLSARCKRLYDFSPRTPKKVI